MYLFTCNIYIYSRAAISTSLSYLFKVTDFFRAGIVELNEIFIIIQISTSFVTKLDFLMYIIL